VSDLQTEPTERQMVAVYIAVAIAITAIDEFLYMRIHEEDIRGGNCAEARARAESLRSFAPPRSSPPVTEP
jgi:hypothetical protein